MAVPNWTTDATTQVAGDGDVVVTKPSGLADGDFLLALCFRGGTLAGDFDTPSGWTKIGTQVNDTGGSDARITVFAKVADSTDAAASNFTFSPADTDGDKSQVKLARITSTSNSFSGGVTALTNSASGSDDSTGGENSVSYSGLTPDSTDALLVMAIAELSDTNIAFSAYATANNDPTWTEESDVLYDPSGIGLNFGIAYGDYTDAGATGNFSATVTVNGSYAGFLVSINKSVDVTVNLDSVSLTATPNDSTVTGGASLTLDSISMTSTPNDSTLTGGTAKWVNPDKSDTSPTITNPDKS